MSTFGGGADPLRYVQADRVLSRRTLTGILVLPLDHGEFFDLTGTGEALWDVLATPRTLSEAAAELLTRFAGPLSEVMADVAPVVDDLVRRNAVLEVEAARP